MARPFTALSPSNQFNYFNALGFYNNVGGSSGSITNNLRDGKSVDQMKDFSNLYYNLSGMDWSVSMNWEDTDGNGGSITKTGPTLYDGFPELTYSAPWVTGTYKVSAYGDDQTSPFIRYAWNSKGSTQHILEDQFGNGSSRQTIKGQGGVYFHEGSDVTPGNGQRNLFVPTQPNIQNAASDPGGLFGLSYNEQNGSPVSCQRLGIQFVGGVNDMIYNSTSNPQHSSKFQAFPIQIGGVPMYAILYADNYIGDYTEGDTTHTGTVLRQVADSACLVKYTERTVVADDENPYEFNGSIEVRTIGPRYNSY
jgi:hypothetical protein